MARRCERCRSDEAAWAWQPDLETFYTLGSHQRGFAVVRVCEGCRDDIKTELLAADTTWDRPMAEHEAEYNAAVSQGAMSAPGGDE